MEQGFVPYQQVFNADLGSGDQFSDVVDIGFGKDVGVVIEHPGTAHTTYFCEVANYGLADVANAKWAAWDEGSTPAAITTAVNTAMKRSPPFNLFRVRANTASGGGAGITAKIRICVKPR